MSRLASVLALLSVPAGAAAQRPAACIPPAQAEDVLVILLPGIVDAVGRRCAPQLRSGALLGSGAPAFAARLRAEGDSAWPRAQAMLGDALGGSMGGFLSEDTVRVVAEQAAGAAVAARLPDEKCVRAERILEPLQSLPARNLARFTIAVLDGTAEMQRLPVRICPQAEPAP